MPDARPRAKERTREAGKPPFKKDAALPEEGRLADLGFMQAYNTTGGQGSSSFTWVRADSTFFIQGVNADMKL